jgi:hypothetical protein
MNKVLEAIFFWANKHMDLFVWLFIVGFFVFIFWPKDKIGMGDNEERIDKR